jgi:hypothetical protein
MGFDSSQKIQSLVRGFLARKTFNAKKASMTKIQMWWRQMLDSWKVLQATKTLA